MLLRFLPGTKATLCIKALNIIKLQKKHDPQVAVASCGWCLHPALVAVGTNLAEVGRKNSIVEASAPVITSSPAALFSAEH